MYQRILVPVDGSPTSDAGLAEAVRLAKLTGARLRLLHVVDEMPFIMSAGSPTVIAGDLLELLRESGREILEKDSATVKAQGGVAVDTMLFDSLDGRLCDRVLDQVRDWQADLVVLGTHGRRGIRRAALGSDAEQIVRHSTVPVLLVRTPG